MLQVNTVRSMSVLDRVTPQRLWLWAIVIALAGVVLRVFWFGQYEADLPFAFGSTLTGHAWALDPQFRAPVAPGALNSYYLTRAFAPGYGVVLRAVYEAAGGATASAHAVGVALLIVQSAMAFVATLVTYALSRRVLFGYLSLLPAALLTLSIALIELPGGIAPQVPAMLVLLLAVWLITLVRECPPGERGARAVALTTVGGLLLGAAVLFNPAILLPVPLILWWGFRGLGREYATLLLVATILLPAGWIAVADSVTPGSLPVDQAQQWLEPAHGNVVSNASEAADRAYNVITPWNERWARGAYVSSNWNWEWILPASIRADASYKSASDALMIVLMLLYAGFALLGVVELISEGAGSAARLIALPVIAVPLATFVVPAGNALRLPVLPLLLIAFALGAARVLDNVDLSFGRHPAPKDAGWT